MNFVKRPPDDIANSKDTWEMAVVNVKEKKKVKILILHSVV